MELEAKLSLQSMEDLNKVAAALKAADSNFGQEQEEDVFLDGPNRELEHRGTVLRIRKSTKCDGSASFKVTLKEHTSVSEGSSVRWQQEEAIDAATAAAICRQPTALLQLPLGVAKAVVEKFGLATLVQSGAISTQRLTFRWASCNAQPGLCIRLDCTTYPFGKRCELEVPHVTVPVSDVLGELSTILTALGVQATLAHESKYQQLRSGSRDAASRSHMVMDAKLSLTSDADYHTVRNALAPHFLSSETHENWFLDGPDRPLAARSTMFRIRIDRQNRTCVATIKEHSNVEGGSALCWTQEEAIPFAQGEQLRTNPSEFFEIEGSALVRTLRAQYGIAALHFVGGFSTVRELYAWPSCVSQPGLVIRLDNTAYPFGSRFELEVPQIRVPVEDVVNELSTILASIGAAFTTGSQTKFEQFADGMAKAFMSPAAS